jgi:hypothetical protein
MRHFLGCYLYACMSCLACCSYGFCQDIPNDLLNNAVRGHIELKRLENSLVEWECLITNKQNGHTSKILATVRANQDSRLVKYGDIVTCFTPEYTFSVRKHPNKNAWMLSKYTKRGTEAKWLSSHVELASAVHPLVSFGHPFATSVNSYNAPEYKLLSTRRLSDTVSELTLRFDTKSQFTSEASQYTAVYELSVPMNYFILSITTHSETAGSNVHPARTTVMKSEAILDATKILINNITKSSTIIGDKSPDVIEIYDFKYHYNEQVNPAEFTLEYYGILLPTDEVYEDRGFNWPLWGGLGVGCIVLSLLISWYLRRRSRLKAGG